MAFAGIAAIFTRLLQPVSVIVDGAPASDFKISSGDGVSKIASGLYANKLINSETVFKTYSFFSGLSLKFKPGVYKLDKSFSIPEIVKILISGPSQQEIRITPGMTVKEIDELLAKKGIVKEGEILNFNTEQLKGDFPFLGNISFLEGFLFPDTYKFFPESDSKKVVSKILANFRDKVGAEVGGLQFLETGDNMDKLVLASLLEKEIPDFEEKRVVAGILEKRLKSGMLLQVDAAVIYAKCGKFNGCKIDRQDFKTDSLYNTYKYLGYPPTSISNPSLDSIKAALSPIKSEYWYYLSDPKTKKTIFSKTIDEHIQNSVKYLY